MLTSDAFSLPRIVDLETEKLLEKQRSLSALESLTPQQEQDLAAVNQKLADLGFRYQTRDLAYTEYLKRRRRGEPESIAAEISEAGPLSEEIKALIKKAVELGNRGAD